jgi:hypothetical protein
MTHGDTHEHEIMCFHTKTRFMFRIVFDLGMRVTVDIRNKRCFLFLHCAHLLLRDVL